MDAWITETGNKSAQFAQAAAKAGWVQPEEATFQSIGSSSFGGSSSGGYTPAPSYTPPPPPAPVQQSYDWNAPASTPAAPAASQGYDWNAPSSSPPPQRAVAANVRPVQPAQAVPRGKGGAGRARMDAWIAEQASKNPAFAQAAASY